MVAADELNGYFTNYSFNSLLKFNNNNFTQKKIHFFETQFDHVQTQLTFAFWFFIITIAKICLFFYKIFWS